MTNMRTVIASQQEQDLPSLGDALEDLDSEEGIE